MDDDKRFGRQTPTKNYVINYNQLYQDPNRVSERIITRYESNDKSLYDWQKIQIQDIRAVDDDELYVHSKYGYSVPRRNGKTDLLYPIMIDDLEHGKKGLYTAHRTSTSSSSAKRLVQELNRLGYEEVLRPKADEVYDHHYVFTKQHGQEVVTLLSTSGFYAFRTRSTQGGLGEGFDTLIIDEAQEYTEEQETALKYVVTDSPNPQTIFMGTPPTKVSKGDVFLKMRNETLSGKRKRTGWAEWSIDKPLDNIIDYDLWYETNPSLGYHLTIDKIEDETTGDKLDFNIQRLGVWILENQNSLVTEKQWNELLIKETPQFKGKIFVGIKSSKNGEDTAMSIALKTVDERIYVECIDCRNKNEGNQWILDFISQIEYRKVVIDGADIQNIIERDMKVAGLKHSILPKVSEVIEANSLFLNAINDKTLIHNNQPSVTRVITDMEKRSIGSNGGFGFLCTDESKEIAIIDSMALAFRECKIAKEEKKKARMSF